jgi:ubiquinone/menaquinone biosynthesis C-methylase UbiE
LVEIAPGFGRWTHYLKDHCARLIAIDLSSVCVEACRRRFAQSSNVEVLQNDGHSLPTVQDVSVDFVVSFDSLVHLDAKTLGDYLAEIRRVLSPSGAAFIHHSNLEAHRRTARFAERLPRWIRRRATGLGLLPRTHWRDPTVSASWVATKCRELGFQNVSQELVNWRNGSRFLIDCFTTIRLGPAQPSTLIHNRSFMRDAREIRRSAQ